MLLSIATIIRMESGVQRAYRKHLASGQKYFGRAGRGQLGGANAAKSVFDDDF
jgi:hypothetical protein